MRLWVFKRHVSTTFQLFIFYIVNRSTLWFFSTRYIFYSIYFIIKYNIELIFANTSIIEYWFFSDVEYVFPRIAPPVYLYFAVGLFLNKNTRIIDVLGVIFFLNKVIKFMYTNRGCNSGENIFHIIAIKYRLSNEIDINYFPVYLK
jgi:hypothetical protein